MVAVGPAEWSVQIKSLHLLGKGGRWLHDGVPLLCPISGHHSCPDLQQSLPAQQAVPHCGGGQDLRCRVCPAAAWRASGR